MNNEKKIYEVEELLSLYDKMLEIINLFSSDASDQLKKLHGYMITDELATDFCYSAKPYAIILYDNKWLSKECINLVMYIDSMLDKMSKNKSLWNDEALTNAIEWQNCRELGQKLLKMLYITYSI